MQRKPVTPCVVFRANGRLKGEARHCRGRPWPLCPVSDIGATFDREPLSIRVCRYVVIRGLFRGAVDLAQCRAGMLDDVCKLGLREPGLAAQPNGGNFAKVGPPLIRGRELKALAVA